MNNKKLTVAELIKKKNVLGIKTKELYSETLDGTFTVKSPDIDFIMDITEMDDPIKANKQLVYDCVVEPNLRDEALQSAFGCTEPHDIVYKLFSAGEVNSIVEELMEMSGMNDRVQVVDKIKKQ